MKVFYSDKMWAENANAFSPSAKKPKLAVESWSKKFQIEIVEPEMALMLDLCRAHNPKYVHDVMTGGINGFGNNDEQVMASLPFTSGSMYSAAKAALKDGVACSPTSGFHHAGYDGGGGFCTLNGLIVAAQKLRVDDGVERLGILDFDQHYGNGTDDIIRRLDLGWISHFSQGGKSEDGEKFLKNIPAIIKELGDIEILLYQAGADPHKDDPLGGWLTTDQLRRRDKRVFETCKKLGIPVAFNLAGGYQTPIEKVLEIHDNTMAEAIRVFES